MSQGTQAGRQETSGSALVLYEVRDRVALLTLNRPEKYNALSLEVLKALAAAVDRAEADDDVGALVLRGAGRHFCAGADLNEIAAVGSLAEAQRWLDERVPYFERLARCPKPVIAALHGFTLGGGLELAMQADLRVAGESAQLGQPEILVGIMPGAGGTQRLARLVGLGRALEWLLTGDRMNAQEAWRIGLVNRVVPDEELLQAAEELARLLTRQPPLSVLYIKRCTREGLQMALEQGLALERQAFVATLASEDRREGVSAFLEKRTPRFQGR